MLQVAEKIRPMVDKYQAAFPALLEIPSKDHPYGALKTIHSTFLPLTHASSVRPQQRFRAQACSEAVRRIDEQPFAPPICLDAHPGTLSMCILISVSYMYNDDIPHACRSGDSEAKVRQKATDAIVLLALFPERHLFFG